MDFDFTSSIMEKLSQKERMAKYQQLASQAEKRGEHAIAKQWRKLAADLEAAERMRGASSWNLNATGGP